MNTRLDTTSSIARQGFGPLSTGLVGLVICLLAGAPTQARALRPTSAASEAEAGAGEPELSSQAQEEEEATQAAADDEGDATFLLDPVVVTATRTERDLATAPATVSVITGEELKKAPVGDLTDAVRNLPGVTLNAGSQGRRNISVRGMGSNYTLILVDGKRVNSSEAVFRHNDLDTSLVPVEAIERIEVVRGSMSSLYGSEALGGVINIITKPVADHWTGGVDAKAQMATSGSDGQEYRSSVYISGPLIQDKLGIRLTGAFDQRTPWHGFGPAGSPLLDAGGSPVLRDNGSPVHLGDLATLEGRQDHNGRARLVWTPDRSQIVSAEYGRAYHTRSGEYFISNNLGVADSVVDRSDVVLGHEGRWDWGTTELRGYWEMVDTRPDELHQDNWVLEGNASTHLGIHSLTVGAEGRWTDLQAPV